MKTFREVTIRGEKLKLNRLAEELAKRLSDGWHRDIEQEHQFRDFSGCRHYCFFCSERTDRRAAGLLLFQDLKGMRVLNICPVKSGDLSITEYNQVLAEFYQFIKPAAEALGLFCAISRDEIKLEDELQPRAFRLLTSFAVIVGGGSWSHPRDRQRLMAFFIECHRTSPAVDQDLIGHWLVEQGWAADKVMKFLTQFEFARDLLRANDEQASVADSLVYIPV